MVMPASVFFATVFTLNAMSRHAEIIAAQAGGMSFHRLARPVFAAAAVAAVLAFVVGELSVGATAKSLELQKAPAARKTTYRYNFVYRADGGWVYTIRTLDVVNKVLKDLVFLRQGSDSTVRARATTRSTRTWPSAPTAPPTTAPRPPGGSGAPPAASSSRGWPSRSSPPGRCGSAR